MFKYFKVSESGDVGVIKINRASKHNSFNQEMWEEYYEVFKYLDKLVKVVVLYGDGKNFCSGIDLNSIKLMNQVKPEFIKSFQKCINAPVEFGIPVISISHGISFGLALDIISATTIRICSKDVKYSIKEIDIGIMADIGSLQRLPLITNNISRINEYALTGSNFGYKEAQELGLVSYVCKDKQECINKAMELADLIKAKYLPAIKGTKKHLELMNINSSSVKNGLNSVSVDNAELMNDIGYKRFFMKKFSKL